MSEGILKGEGWSGTERGGLARWRHMHLPVRVGLDSRTASRKWGNLGELVLCLL
jgi:hypothetical protein